MIQKKVLFVIIAQVWSILVSTELHAGGWEWKLGTEGGYFQAEEDLNSSKIKYIAALSGSARYNRTFGMNSYLLQFRLRPELYGPQRNNYTINASAAGQYLRKWGDFDLSTGMTVRKQNYHLHSDRLDISTFQMFGSVSWFFAKKFSSELEGRYDNAVLSGNARNIISSWSASPKLRFLFSNYGSVSAGMLVESFSAHTNDVFFTSRSSTGWRLGPEFAIDYSRNWLISIHYLPSKRFYNSSNEAHMEQEINIVAGKDISAHWSVFILADYYFRDIDSSASRVVYTHTNYENRIHAKLVYSWKKCYAAYFKLAYTKNELINEKIAWSGTQVSVGIEIQK
ncbi:hypothetical protein JNL27_04810 [bacterium]|nr:hypothetical protein [bacterium]